jgi:hypothetical protein
MRKQALAAATFLLVSGMPLSARDVTVPEKAPRLALRVPDDWTLNETKLGVEAVSPQRDSYVFAKIMRRPPDDPNAWVAAVMETLRARGVAFKNVAPTAKGAEPAKPGLAKEAEARPARPDRAEPDKSPSAPAAEAMAPSAVAPMAKAPDVSAAAPDLAKPAAPAAPVPEAKAPGIKTAEAPTADQPKPTAAAPAPKAPDISAAAPDLAKPAAPAALVPEAKAPDTKTAEAPTADQPKPTAAASALSRKAPDVSAAAPDLAKPAPAAPPPVPIKQIIPTFALNTPVLTVLPFPRHVLSYKDTTLEGHRVDVQLVTYRLPDGSILFIAQESRPDDTRAIEIATSVRSLK